MSLAAVDFPEQSIPKLDVWLILFAYVCIPGPFFRVRIHGRI